MHAAGVPCPSGGAGVAWHVSWGAPGRPLHATPQELRPSAQPFGMASRLGGCRTIHRRGAVLIVSG